MAGHRDRDGFRAKLSARSAPLRLATSEILDAFADDDGVSVKDGVAEPALPNPQQRLDAVSRGRYRSRRLSDARVALVHRIADQEPARRAHARSPTITRRGSFFGSSPIAARSVRWR